jgi:hypothetical protein
MLTKRSKVQTRPGDFSDSDFPIFRLADAYLMYAECGVRGAGGSIAATATYNALRTVQMEHCNSRGFNVKFHP